MGLFSIKKPEETISNHLPLKRCLNAFDLTLLGIGGIIGAGIFVLTGVAAATKAGPAIILSYLVAGIASALSALAYAELAATVGGCGSAYGYSYAVFGEIIAWIIGWDLILEYLVSCSAVAIGWSGYISNLFHAMGYPIARSLELNPFEGGWINLPASVIILILAILLTLGVRQSSRFNMVMVLAKLVAISLFLIVASSHINPEHWHPFLPYGWSGMISGAALIFFAYIGFDAVSTAAEEAINPQRNLPIGILCSLAICTLLYILVATFITGITHYSTLNVSSPVATTILRLGYHWVAATIALGALAGITTVILVFFYGLTRILLAISRDGLLPAIFASINASTHTPVKSIWLGGAIMAAIAGIMPIHDVAALVNIGTLAAFCVVSGGVIILRYKRPSLSRPFKMPWFPWTPLLGLISSIYLMLHLGLLTWYRFIVWMLIGIAIYFVYSRKHSLLATK